MSKLPFDLLNYPYHSRRTATVANNGMVATTQPLASQAGLEILKKGGECGGRGDSNGCRFNGGRAYLKWNWRRCFCLSLDKG